MVVLRCTESLRHRLKRAGGDAGRSTTALGDWYGHLIRLGRRHVLLFISERSRLPVMMPVRDADRLAVALPLAVAEMLQSVGIGREAIERECRLMSPMVVGRTASRSLLGSINDFVFMAQARLITGTKVPLFDIARELAETPVMPFAGRHPSAVTREILGSGAETATTLNSIAPLE